MTSCASWRRRTCHYAAGESPAQVRLPAIRSQNKLPVLLKTRQIARPHTVRAAKAANTNNIHVLGDGRRQAARLLSRHAEVLLQD